MVNIVNQVISKQFARFLKEHGVYMDYVRNVMHHNNYDIAYIKKYCVLNECHYVLGGFLWPIAKYPTEIDGDRIAMSHFWGKINSDWLKELRHDSNKQKNN